MSSASTLTRLPITSALPEEKTAADWALQAKAALTGGNYLQARQSLAQGLEFFPSDKSLQRLATLLAPPQVRIRPNETVKNAAVGPTLSSQQKNQAWLRQHGADYPEKWIAVFDGELMGAASSIQELRAKCGDLSRALVTRIL